MSSSARKRDRSSLESSTSATSGKHQMNFIFFQIIFDSFVKVNTKELRHQEKKEPIQDGLYLHHKSLCLHFYETLLISGTMIQEDGKRSPSGERRKQSKVMKIQPPPSSSSSSSPAAGSRDNIRECSEDDSEVEGEFSPANSGVDPNFLRAIKKSSDLSKQDQEVV